MIIRIVPVERLTDLLGRVYCYIELIDSVIPIFLAGLVVQTEYEITVQSFNELGDSQYQVKGLIAYTSSE